MIHVKQIRVLIYTYPMIGQNHGGLQIQIENTIRCLRKLGCYVKLFNQWTDMLEEYNIIHCFYFGDTGVYPLIKKAKEKGVSVIISTVYNAALDISKEKITYKLSKIHPSLFYIKYIQRNMIKYVDRFIALSNYEKEVICDIFHISEKKFCIISNGISDIFIQEYEEENGFTEETGLKQYVLHVGQFTRNKNQIAIIKAMEDMKTPLVCIGQIVEQDYYEECKKIAGEHVYFFQPIENSDRRLLNIYRGASTFVLPSYKEVYPLSVIEAILTGNRVLITRNSMIGDSLATFQVNKISPNDINGIKRWILNNACKEKIIIPQEQKKSFAWMEIAKRLLDIYIEVMIENDNKVSKKNI